MCSPVAVENLLHDTVQSGAFSTIQTLLKVYVIMTFSETVVERSFSKINLIMTKNRCLGFKLTFQSCTMKNPYKTLLVLVSPKCTP